MYHWAAAVSSRNIQMVCPVAVPSFCHVLMFEVFWYTNAITIGCRLEQKTMYFLMMPLSLSGGSQETNTTELLEAAALTPAGGPGTGEEESSVGFRGAKTNILNRHAHAVLVCIAICINHTEIHCVMYYQSISRPNIPSLFYYLEKGRENFGL